MIKWRWIMLIFIHTFTKCKLRMQTAKKHLHLVCHSNLLWEPKQMQCRLWITHLHNIYFSVFYCNNTKCLISRSRHQPAKYFAYFIIFITKSKQSNDFKLKFRFQWNKFLDFTIRCHQLSLIFIDWKSSKKTNHGLSLIQTKRKKIREAKLEMNSRDFVIPE